jgi:alpha-methylacyl-CoA racemase
MGPLRGVRVLEMAGSIAGSFAATVLADLGADVLRIDRAAQVTDASGPLGRGRRSVAVDLKNPAGRDALLRLVARADVLIESGRPGVAEKLGFGPDVCLERNERLVYARVTGWGQDGPLARQAGHDITFLGVAGALATECGGVATAPEYYLASVAGGGLYAAIGIQAALLERSRSGRGQVVDAAMVEGAAHLAVTVAQWRELNTTVVDAPFYTTYPCADGRSVSVGAVEPRFYAQLLDGLGLSDAELPDQYDRSRWPELSARLREAFAGQDAAHWEKTFADSDACVAPVLTVAEAAQHPQAVARGSFVQVAGQAQAAPTPRFSRTPAGVPTPAPLPGQHTAAALESWGIAPETVADLTSAGGIR